MSLEPSARDRGKLRVVAAAVEHAYAYAVPSRAALIDDGADLDLATSGGVPTLFSGTLAEPAVHAAAILAVARCARASFYNHAHRLADPVVTCHADRLRFEALSSCASVYARHDALLSGGVVRVGATNVDVNPATRTLLARVGGGSRLELDVGDDAVEFATEAGAAIERRVKLPVRWVKGFGEAGVAARALKPAFELAPRFLRASPPRGRDAFLAPGPRWSLTGGVAVLDPGRLRLLAPLAPFADAVRVWEGSGGVSAFTLALRGGGQFTLVLSPASSRGFSGEGATLEPLMQPVEEFDLAWQTRLEGPAEVLDGLAARGRAGYDLEAGAYFHRDLPYDLARVEMLHPRLRDARALVAEGAVRWDGDHAWVGRHRVAPPVCTCDWWVRYRGERGPCKHVLAATLVRDGG